jgi:hypothetical protein
MPEIIKFRNGPGFLITANPEDKSFTFTNTSAADWQPRIDAAVEAEAEARAAADAGKVDKEAGKGLSSADFTGAEKEKLSGVEAGAQVNDVTASDLAGVLSDAKSYADTLAVNGVHYKGEAANKAALPADAETGDEWLVNDDGAGHSVFAIWDGSEWDYINIDLGAYRTAADQDDIDAGFFDTVEIDGSAV